ncbi:DUF547 domain-containing protein [Castellaniella sp.]|uniref:DUF547 domain-containing protein n=1 Tax=Castellaniella sp. TaxID=1955812 RepID=UPI0025BADA49|nr:DUF547 domain-containing protein [Castellaniella sp.]
MRRWIRLPMVAVLMLLSAAAVAAPMPSSVLWTSLLQRHVVVIDGGHASRVDYAGMRRDRSALDAYTRELSAITPAQFAQWNRTDQMAFLINAYNAFTVQLVLRRWPRLSSIKDIGGLFSRPWKQDFFVLLGQRTNLDHIESLLRTGKYYADPRVHFALNCASIGCPMLRAKAYAGGRLDRQLEDAMQRFLGDRSRNRYDPSRDVLRVSRIFDWYAGDFRDGPGRSVAGLLAAHAAQLSDDPKIQARIRAQRVDIQFLPYNWQLNAVGAP